VAAFRIEDHAPPHFARYFDFFRYAAECLELAALDANTAVSAVVQVSLSNKVGTGVFLVAVESGGGSQRETATGATVAQAE
jgi:anti-sigma-K factor RskA